MKRTLFLALLSLGSFWSPTSTLSGQEADSPQDPVRRFEGSLGKNLGITLLIATRDESDGGLRYLASYHYHKSGLPITLAQEDGAEGLEFREVSGYTTEGEEQITGRWRIAWNEKKITGTWISPDGKKKLPIDLQETYPAGSVLVEQLQIDFSYTEQVGTARRGKERELLFLRVPGSKTKALNTRLAQLARDAAAPDSKVEATPEAIAKHLRAEVRSELEADSEYISTQGDDFIVRMNESGFLTVENLSHSYEGGAHGNYGSSFHTLEIATGKSLQLTDLVQPGFEKKWATLGAAQLRKYYGLKENAPLKEAGLFEDTLELSEAWFLVPGGIGFSYAPYEIGPYALGAVEFVLPWKEIISDLKPGTRVHELAVKLVPAEKK